MATINESANREYTTQSDNSKTIYEDSTDFKRMLEELSQNKQVRINDMSSDGNGVSISFEEVGDDEEASFIDKLKASLGNFYNLLEAIVFIILTFLSVWFLNYLLTDSSVTHIKVGLFLLPILFMVKGFESLWAFIKGMARDDEDY